MEVLRPVKRWVVDSLGVEVHGDGWSLGAAAAGVALDYLREVLGKQGRAAVILASASSQVRFLEALGACARGAMDWSRVTVFHMDEYLGISAEHGASFRRFMRVHVEERVKPGQIHYLAGDALLPMEECERYSGLLRAQPIDLCCLGIGENGHLAFNDPPVANFGPSGRATMEEGQRAVTIVKLDEACRRQQVGEGHFPNLDAVPQYALTLTVPMLCSAKRILGIVPERRKAQAVRDALWGPVSTVCPASILRKQPHATLFLDTESASLL